MWTSENRGRYDRSKLRYPSDLTDEEWALIAPSIPPAKRGGNKRTFNEREVVNGYPKANNVLLNFDAQQSHLFEEFLGCFADQLEVNNQSFRRAERDEQFVGIFRRFQHFPS